MSNFFGTPFLKFGAQVQRVEKLAASEDQVESHAEKCCAPLPTGG